MSRVRAASQEGTPICYCDPRLAHISVPSSGNSFISSHSLFLRFGCPLPSPSPQSLSKITSSPPPITHNIPTPIPSLSTALLSPHGGRELHSLSAPHLLFRLQLPLLPPHCGPATTQDTHRGRAERNRSGEIITVRCVVCVGASLKGRASGCDSVGWDSQ